MNKSKVRIISICGVCIIAACASGSFLYYKNLKKTAKDFSSQAPDQIRAYLDSNDFKNLDDRTRRQIGRQARGRMMQYTVDEYFKLPEDKKAAYLDKVIKEMNERRQQFERRRDANEPNRPDRRQFARSAADRRARMERTVPLDRAKRSAFREAIRQRRQQKNG